MLFVKVISPCLKGKEMCDDLLLIVTFHSGNQEDRL